MAQMLQLWKANALVPGVSVCILQDVFFIFLASIKQNDGWFTVPGVGGKYFYTKGLETWDMARRLCEAEASYLVVINSELERDGIIKELLQQGVPQGDNEWHLALWVGISDIEDEGTFITVQGMY